MINLGGNIMEVTTDDVKRVLDSNTNESNLSEYEIAKILAKYYGEPVSEGDVEEAVARLRMAEDIA